MRHRTGSMVVSAFLVIGFLWAITTKEAHAYIDLGSGSLLIQMLFASLFASLFALKLYWRRFTGGIARFMAKVKGLRDTHRVER